MATEAKITQLTAASTNPAATDLFEMSYDPAGTPASYKVTMTRVAASTATILGLSLGGTLTTGAAFTTTPANALTLTTTGATNVTLPTSGTLVNTDVTTLSSLTSVGTIGTGIWQGTLVGSTYGGTGVNNGASTITLAGNLVTSGANSLTLTTTGATNVTLPTSGTLATTSLLGTMAAQNANTVAITGGAISGLTSLDVSGPTVITWSSGAAVFSLSQGAPASHDLNFEWQDNGVVRWIESVRVNTNDDWWLYNAGRASADIVVAAATGAVVLSNSITTGAPAGGTAGAWKGGILVTDTVTPDTTRYIQLDVGGTLYKLIVST